MDAFLQELNNVHAHAQFMKFSDLPDSEYKLESIQPKECNGKNGHKWRSILIVASSSSQSRTFEFFLPSNYTSAITDEKAEAMSKCAISFRKDGSKLVWFRQ